ncbi:receptor-type tyrosine-protein phosphatase F-like [Haemaphysalis longicornis]
MEPRRALVLWTGAARAHRYEVTWCCWVGGLSACQNKSSGTDGVVITHLGAWLTYDVSVGTPSALLFTARFRTRPDTPSEPMLLHVDRVGGGEARLSWSAPETPRGPLQTYDVSWCTAASCESLLETSRRTRHVVLNHVRPSTNYTFRVRAKNVLEDVPLEGPHAEVAVFAPPKGLVFQLEMSEWTAVSLSWSSVEGTMVGVCTVKHCLVGGGGGEGPAAGSSCEKAFVPGSRRDINNTHPWTVARVEVTDPSDTLLFYTIYRSPPGRPSAPLEARVAPLNSSALELRWSAPEFGRGPVDGYLVKWHTFYEDGESVRLGSRDLRSLVITDVEELNTYTIQVAAYNLWSGSFLAGDEAIAYGISYSSGMHVNVSVGPTWAELTWTLRHAIVEELLLTCCEPDYQQPDTCPHEVRLNSSERRHVLWGLQPQRAYDVRFFRYEGMALVLRKRFRTPDPAGFESSERAASNATVRSVDGVEMLVSWYPGQVCDAVATNESADGDLGRYLVSWLPEGADDSSVRQEVTTDTQLTLRQLRPSTAYVVEVQALGTCADGSPAPVWTFKIKSPPAATTYVTSSAR